MFSIRGKLRNPIFGNILTALYKEISLILKSENLVLIIKGFNLVLRGSFEIQFLAIFQLRFTTKIIDFEIGKHSFYD